jgi:quinol monooxygenase YgiN
MAKVVLLVNVELENGKREEYLEAVGSLRDRFRESGDVSYSVYENQGKEKDSFTEMFTFKDMASYEAFDEGEDGSDTNEIFAKILEMGKRAPKYTTLVEVE